MLPYVNKTTKLKKIYKVAVPTTVEKLKIIVIRVFYCLQFKCMLK